MFPDVDVNDFDYFTMYMYKNICYMMFEVG